MSDINLEKRLHTMTDKEIVKRLLSYALPFKSIFSFTLVLMLVSVLI